jgi:hypothetical protein
MPAAIDLVVNNAAAVAKTFTLLSPAAGNGSNAEWANKVGTIAGVFPRFTAQANSTGNQSRKLTLKLRIPSSYTETVTGLTRVASAYEANVTISVPNDFPESYKDDAVAFTSNLLAHATVKAMMRDALPAT